MYQETSEPSNAGQRSYSHSITILTRLRVQNHSLPKQQEGYKPRILGFLFSFEDVTQSRVVICASSSAPWEKEGENNNNEKTWEKLHHKNGVVFLLAKQTAWLDCRRLNSSESHHEIITHRAPNYGCFFG